MCRRIAYVALLSPPCASLCPRTHPNYPVYSHSEGTRWARCGVRTPFVSITAPPAFAISYHLLFFPPPSSLAALPAPLGRRYHGLQLE